MADSSKDLQLRELKDMINDLKKMIKTLQATVDAANKREEALTQERDNLKEEVDLLRKKLFGSSSEKRSMDVPGQLNLFNEAELEQNPTIAEPEALESLLPEKETKKRKSRATNAERFKGIPVVKKYLDLPDAEKVCPVCNAPLVKIGEEFVRRELSFVPAKLKVIEIYSLNYICPECNNDDVTVIKKGKDGHAHMLHGMAAADTIAWVMYQKFCNSLPYTRQEKDWEQYGVAITRATMANWVIRNTLDYFTPMYDYFHRQLLKREFAMADETPLQVLHESGRRAQTKSYMWLFRSGEDGGFPIILYKYSETRAGNNAVEFLEGFKGYLMCDGYSGYNKVPDAKRTACWAHIRRYLTDAIPKGKQLDYTQPSVQGMMYINQLFHLEDVIKAKYSSFDAIKKARLEKEKPIVEGFLSWLDKQNPVRGSRMDKAVTYIQNRRSYLMTYLEDGHCSFSNNLSENAIRPFTVGRKNWLFCDTPNGAQASAIVYTMVEMAKANGVNVYHYLTYLLEKLPNDRMSDEELDRLAPWNEEVKSLPVSKLILLIFIHCRWSGTC
ncbi:IS66 family transposase [bacterium 210928-DFI.3.100]|nr:IS66 family transposase [bacterium 210928-DFI.3.100]